MPAPLFDDVVRVTNAPRATAATTPMTVCTGLFCLRCLVRKLSASATGDFTNSPVLDTLIPGSEKTETSLSSGRIPLPVSTITASESVAFTDVTRTRPTFWPARRTIISSPVAIPSRAPLLRRTSVFPRLIKTVASGRE